MKRQKQRQAKAFVERIAALRFENVFNPYCQTCVNYDLADAAEIRKHNLTGVLEAALTGPVHSIWIARDLGYKGGRRTGLALTDEIHLIAHAQLLGSRPLVQATKGPAMAERTATIVWEMLRLINRPIFLWNVFPLHPHLPGDPMSNRCHTRAERVASLPLLVWLVEALQPKTVIAIGEDARGALAKSGINAVSVRHPSYGGRSDFVSKLQEIYNLPVRRKHRANQLSLI